MRWIEPWTETRRRPCFHISLSLADRVQEERHLLDHAVYLSPRRLAKHLLAQHADAERRVHA
jgi:hypothetical protein